MIKYFKGSIYTVIIGAVCALLWAMYRHPGSELLCLFVVFFLSILEITLSFDNAVVNASKLERMTPEWQHRFITWGILIAVFGMRFLFPLLVVCLFSGMPLLSVFNIAINDVELYESYLHVSHSSLVVFGGAFLFMLFLSFFCAEKRDLHWFKPVENFLQKLNLKKYQEACIVLIPVTAVFVILRDLHVFISGIIGIILFVLIDFTVKKLEEKENAAGKVAKLGFTGFVYLELIDASFSLDGVLGAFAISRDIIIIMIGLAIGAMFVRSLTIFAVEKKVLKNYPFLEHGAHWAIGLLAGIMFVSAVKEVPEVVTGLTGLLIVGKSFIDSLKVNSVS